MTIVPTLSRRAFGGLMFAATAACGSRIPVSNADEIVQAPTFMEGYGPVEDAGFTLPGIPDQYLQGVNRRMSGQYIGEAPPNSIDVDPYAKFLYHVKGDGTATRYPVGVGRQGRTLSGRATGSPVFTKGHQRLTLGSFSRASSS